MLFRHQLECFSSLLEPMTNNWNDEKLEHIYTVEHVCVDKRGLTVFLFGGIYTYVRMFMFYTDYYR